MSPDLRVERKGRRRGREREREGMREKKNIYGLPSLCALTGARIHNLGMCLDGIELATFWCLGQSSNQLSHPARDCHFFSCSHVIVLIQVPWRNKTSRNIQVYEELYYRN